MCFVRWGTCWKKYEIWPRNKKDTAHFLHELRRVLKIETHFLLMTHIPHCVSKLGVFFSRDVYALLTLSMIGIPESYEWIEYCTILVSYHDKTVLIFKKILRGRRYRPHNDLKNGLSEHELQYIQFIHNSTWCSSVTVWAYQSVFHICIRKLFFIRNIPKNRTICVNVELVLFSQAWEIQAASFRTLV